MTAEMQNGKFLKYSQKVFVMFTIPHYNMMQKRIRREKIVHEQPTIIDKIGRVISIAGNAILMNLLFLLCSIPIVTIGQAWSGLLTAVRYNIRGDKWQTGFWFGFKTRFWRGTISWCVMAALDFIFMRETLNIAAQIGFDVPSVAAGVVFALMSMLTFSMQILNVYVPTGIGDWLRNSVNMVFKVPLELLACGGLFWAPLIMFFAWFGMFWHVMVIFLTVYFVLVAAVGTLLMKNALVHYLLEARKEGILIADEGKKKESEQESEDK